MAETVSDIRCRFRWHGRGWGDAIDTVVTKACVIGCGGHNKFAFVLLGDAGSRQADRTPESTCSKCGNRAGLTNAMMKDVFAAADSWSAPQLERRCAKKERDQQLLERLWDLINEVQPDVSIREAIGDYGFNLLQLFYRKANSDEKRFKEMMSGGWEHAVLANDYFAESKPWCTLGFIASVMSQGNQERKAKFVKAWKRRSRFRLGRLRFMAVDDWFYNARHSMVCTETEYILKQLSAWQAYAPGKEFRIVANMRQGRFQDVYRLETRRISPRR